MLSLYSIGLIFSQLLLGVTTFSGPTITEQQSMVIKQNIISLTNAERKKNDLGALKENEALSAAAQGKLEDMFLKNYWDHKGPNGETAWDFIDKEGYIYLLAGENLARGFDTSAEAVAAWMASPSHRENILNSRFRDIGIAIGSGNLKGVKTTLIVQIFGEPKTAFASAQSVQTNVLGQKELIPEIKLNNSTAPSKLPFFGVWIFIFGLILLDGIMIRRLGLHISRVHVFNLRVSLLISGFGLLFLMVGFVGIA